LLDFGSVMANRAIRSSCRACGGISRVTLRILRLPIFVAGSTGMFRPLIVVFQGPDPT